MPLPSFARQTIPVRDPGTRIVNGSEVADWDNPSEPREYRGLAVPSETDEYNRARTAVRTGWNVYLHPTDKDGNPVVVHDTSKVTLPDGNDYAVIGQPAEVPGPRGSVDHVFFYAERWAG